MVSRKEAPAKRRRVAPKMVVYRAPKSEMKYFDTNVAYSGLTATSACINLVDTATVRRIGNKIKIIGIHVKGFINNNSAKTNYVRVMLVGTREPADVTTSTELLATTGGGTANISVAAGLNALYHPINKVKFRLLHDRVYKLGPSTSVDGSECKMINFMVKPKRNVWYEDGTQGADNQSYRYHLILIPSEAGDDTLPSTIEISYCIRTFYVDS